MLVNQVTKKSQQVARSIEAFWVMLILVGFLTVSAWLSVLVGLWDSLLFAVPLTLILTYNIISLRWLYAFRRKFEASPSEYAHTHVREPMFAYLFSHFFHK